MEQSIKLGRSAYSFTTLNIITAVFMVGFHVGAVAAFWYFSWTNLIVALVLHWLAVGFGISLGYHRLHTHRGFKTSKAFEYFLALCGTLTLEGGPVTVLEGAFGHLLAVDERSVARAFIAQQVLQTVVGDFRVLARDVGVHQLQVGSSTATDHEDRLVDRDDPPPAAVGDLEPCVHQTGFAFNRPTWMSRPVKS